MKYAGACLFVLVAIDLTSTDAFARGGGSNFMNAPGYQRRLQESRGQVTVQSNGPYLTPPSAYPGRKWRKRGRR